MEKVVLQVEVAKSVYEVVEHSAKIVKAIKESLKDGFQPGQDIPVAVMALVNELPAVVAQVPAIPADFAENKKLCLRGANEGAWCFVDAFEA